MSGSRLNITLEDGAGVPLLTLAGDLHLPDVPRLMAALTTALVDERHTLVCDVGALETPMTDSLLTVFPAALRRAGGWPQADLHLAGARADLRAALRRSRLNRFLGLHATVDDAVAAAGAGAPDAVQRFALPPLATTLAEVRAAVRELHLADRAPGGPTYGECQGVTDAALLVVTELVTNSIVHVARPFSLSLARSPHRLLVAVTDPSRKEPVLRSARPTSQGGRGIQLVAALSDAWGVRLVHRQGKTVWASLSTAALPAVPVPRARPPLDAQG